MHPECRCQRSFAVEVLVQTACSTLCNVSSREVYIVVYNTTRRGRKGVKISTLQGNLTSTKCERLYSLSDLRSRLLDAEMSEMYMEIVGLISVSYDSSTQSVLLTNRTDSGTDSSTGISTYEVIWHSEKNLSYSHALKAHYSNKPIT